MTIIRCVAFGSSEVKMTLYVPRTWPARLTQSDPICYLPSRDDLLSVIYFTIFRVSII